MDTLNWLLGLFFFSVSVQYILGPILVYANHRVPERYKFDLLDPDAFLAKRDDTFRSLHEEITNAGFRHAGSAELATGQVSTYFSIYYSQEKMLTCTLAGAHADNLTTTTQMEFSQSYTDGTLIDVNNGNTSGIFPSWDIKEIYRFPTESSFGDLLATTEKITGKRRQTRQPVPVTQGQEFATIESHLNDELNHLIHLGWVSPKLKNNQHKLTAKGAALMTWKRCWPIKTILSRVAVSKSLKVLKNA